MNKIYIAIVVVIAIIVVGAGFYYGLIGGPAPPTTTLTTTTPTTSTSSPSPTPATTTTSALTSTLDTTTTTPVAPQSGKVQGTLMGAKTQRPLAGAAIVLCLITGERECTLQADLAARVGEDGSFELSEVPPGVYVVLYDPSGKAMEGWKEIDQMMINYEIDKRNRIPLSDEFHEVFMAGGMLTVHNLSVTFKEGEVVDFDGAVTSSKHGLTMEFYDLNPIMVDVKPGETSNVEIAALATDVTP